MLEKDDCLESPGMRAKDGDQHTGYLLGSTLETNTYRKGERNMTGSREKMMKS